MPQKLLAPQDDWHKVQFVAPITTQSIHNVGPSPDGTLRREIRVRGPAIHAITTRNGTRFPAEELAKAAQTLENKPILKDHDNSVDSIVGRTVLAYFDEAANAVMFEGIIKDQKMVQMIEEGLITSVSIGALVGDFEDLLNEDGEVIETIVREVEFVEISLVAVPADPNAGVAKAFYEAYKARTSHSPQHKETRMAEEIVKEPVTESKETDLMEELQKLSTTVSEALGKFEETTSALNQRLESLESRFEEAAEEAPVEEASPAETPETDDEAVDETVGSIVTEEQVENNESTNALHIELGDKGWQMTGDYAAFGAVRLTR